MNELIINDEVPKDSSDFGINFSAKNWISASVVLISSDYSAGLPPEKKIEKNNVNNMQNIGTKVL